MSIYGSIGFTRGKQVHKGWNDENLNKKQKTAIALIKQQKNKLVHKLGDASEASDEEYDKVWKYVQQQLDILTEQEAKIRES